MRWQFSIIYPNTTTEIIDEPVGWDSIEWTARRNMKHHGIFNNISTDSFEFVGDAFTILNNEYNTYGANADLTFLVEYDCDYSGTWTEYYRGKFDFNTFQRECGDYCCVKMAISASSCVDIFLSRNDQDVNLASAVDLDNNAITPLTEYAVRFNGQTIALKDKANNDSGQTFNYTIQDNTGTTGGRYYYFPVYLPTNELTEFGNFPINQGAPDLVQKSSGTAQVLQGSLTDYNDYAQFLTIYTNINNPSFAINAPVYVEWKAKGNFKITTNYNATFKLTLVAQRTNWSNSTGQYNMGTVVIASGVTLSANVQTTIAFDESDSFTLDLPNSDLSAYYFYWYIEILKTAASSADTVDISIEHESGTNKNYYWIYADSESYPVNVNCYNLQDVMMFLPRAYTGESCFEMVMDTAKLNFFHITNGLKIRRVTEPSEPSIYAGWQFMFENIQKIFNIGWGFNKGDTQLAIGELTYFYDAGTFCIDIGAVDKATFTHARDLTYSGATIGYNKWAGEEYNGLDEVNTKREYARNIDSNNNKLDLMCDIIAGGYTIEITRRRSQDNNGTEDWRFDNDIFIVNITYSEEYDQIMTYNGIDSGAANIYSPSTRYNYKITPARMMMEWMKSFVSANPDYTLDELQFRSGTGNYLARGLMSNQYNLEIQSTIESETLAYDDFYSQDYIKPLWSNIYATFEAPFSMTNYEEIKQNPYGIVSFTCAGVEYQGYLIECNHKPNDGIASLKVLLKYGA